MKIVVIGGTGVLGSKVVGTLRDRGHDVIAASRSTGVDALTGEGLADAVTGADVVVDVSNSPSFDAGPVMEFFTTSTKNLVAAARGAGVGHYVAVSIVGCDQLPESGYMRAKVAQENVGPSNATQRFPTRSRARMTHSSNSHDTTITASLTVGDKEVYAPPRRRRRQC